MKRRVLIAAAALALAAAGCASEADPERMAAAERSVVEIVLDTIWSRGGLADTIIELPHDLRVDGDLILLADGARRGVAALDRRNGATLWTSGRRGGGPGEYERPSVVETLPDGRILVADTRSSRISVLDRDGRYVTAFPIEDAEVTGLCALADGSIVAAAAAHGENFTRFGPDGRVLGRAAVPWQDLREQPMLARQLVSATPPDRRECLFVLSLGRGFTAYDGQSFTMTRDFVERVPAPIVEMRESGTRSNRVRTQQLITPTLAARAAAASADHWFIVFEGNSRDAGRIVDVYARDGEYRYSFRLPAPVRELAWADSTFYTLRQVDGVPVVTALRVGRAE